MSAFRHTPLSIPCEHDWLDGLLSHEEGVRGIVILVQNGCVLRSELREALVARRLQEAGLATLCVDLLTRHEDQRDADAHFNIPLMSNRLRAIFEWLEHQPVLGVLPLALSASGTTCGAAVRACARERERAFALVCRAGRPDLAGAGPLSLLACPTRFVVGGADGGVARYQRPAYDHLSTTRDWQVVDDAEADFRAPGTLEQAARLTAEWVLQHLPEREAAADGEPAKDV